MQDQQSPGQEKIGFEVLEERRAPRIGFSAAALADVVEGAGSSEADGSQSGDAESGQQSGLDALKGLIGNLTGDETVEGLNPNTLNSLDNFDIPGQSQMITSEGGGGLYDPAQFDPPAAGIDAPGSNV